MAYIFTNKHKYDIIIRYIGGGLRGDQNRLYFYNLRKEVFFLNSICKSVYDPKNLHAIVLASGLTREKVSELTGVPVATLTSYMRESPSLPNLKHLTALADFFAVPLDFITGRCDKELADNIVNNYGRYFMELRRAPFEVYLDGRKQEKGTVYDAVEGETPGRIT